MKLKETYDTLLFEENLLLELDGQGIYDKFYKSHLDFKTFRHIVQFDPKTIIKNQEVIKVGRYSKILLNLFLKKELKAEDLPKANEYLTYVYKHNIPLDFNKIKSLGDIYAVIQKYLVIDQTDLESILPHLSKNDYEILHDGDEWIIYKPLSEKGACYLGVGTEWCTTWGPYSLNKKDTDKSNYFSRYSGDLYVIINKQNPNEEKYQFHINSEQYMNKADRPIEVGKFLNKTPELKHFFFPSFVNNVTPIELNEELEKISLLTTEDAMLLLRKSVDSKSQKNPFVIALLNRDEKGINSLIQDDNLDGDVSFDGKSFLSFDVKRMGPITDSFYYTVSSYESDLNDSRNRVYNDMGDLESNNEYIKEFVNDFCDKNKNDITQSLGTVDIESFKKIFFNELSSNDNTTETFIDNAVDLSVSEFEGLVETELNEYKKYVIFDIYSRSMIVSVNMAFFLRFIIEQKITNINDNTAKILDDYLLNTQLSEDYQYIYDYQQHLPKPDDGGSFDNFVDSLFDDFIEENTHENCKPLYDMFYALKKKFFPDDNNTFENEHIIVGIDSGVNCENGGVMIRFLNKDTNKSYHGYVKVENLVNYINNYQLFETIITFKKNI